jgi:hypothetical protein
MALCRPKAAYGIGGRETPAGEVRLHELEPVADPLDAGESARSSTPSTGDGFGGSSA